MSFTLHLPTDAFIPLGAAKAPARSASFDSLPAPAAEKTAPAEPVPCAKPVVTLQRNGELVSGIRIQCGCGEVIELSCVY